MFVTAMLAGGCEAAPSSQQQQQQPLFADLKSERDSLNANEVGPNENWTLFNRLTKSLQPPSNSDRTDSESARAAAVLKEIEEFSRFVTVSPSAAATDSTTVAGENTATGRPGDDAEQRFATDYPAASDSVRFGSIWRDRDDVVDAMRSSTTADQAADDDSSVEDMIRKVSTDLKKLYGKIKEVIAAVKNWYALWKVANTVFLAAAA